MGFLMHLSPWAVTLTAKYLYLTALPAIDRAVGPRTIGIRTTDIGLRISLGVPTAVTHPKPDAPSSITAQKSGPQLEPSRSSERPDTYSPSA